MKLWSSLLASAAVAQYADEANRWGGYEVFGGFNYDNSPGKADGGLAYNQGSPLFHENGLYCWMCDERLNIGQETESAAASGANAYTRCLAEGQLQKCVGEQRTCLFEERRRNGIVYSVTTGCKQTDACLALWRRNQRFTLPFMNFGDMSITDHKDGAPIYIDDECTTYENTLDSLGNADVASALAAGGNGHAMSYAKFSYDTTGENQSNGQMSQWESSCRWCCAAQTDNVCNLKNANEYDSPFATMGCTGATVTSATPPTVAVASPACKLSTDTFTDGSRRFFAPFMLADPRGKDRDLSANTDATTNPIRFIDEFVKTAMADLSLTVKNPVTGEGRNSLGMDKYKFRGNQFVSVTLGEHAFEHQSDMPSQENRDFFDQRAPSS